MKGNSAGGAGGKNGQPNGQSHRQPLPQPPGPPSRQAPFGLPSDDELEKLEAELDRGWDLIESGESGSLQKARELGDELLTSYPDAPEVLVMLGMLDSLEGDVEKALERYAQAHELDPDYFEPLLCAAELYIWELGEDEKGLKLCQKAQEVAEEEEEYLDALLLQAEAEINLGREKAALATLRQMPDIDLPEPRYNVRAGRLFLDLGQVPEAEQHFLRAHEQDAEIGDALHGLGLCAERRSKRDEMIGYFRKVRDVDLREARPPWALTEEHFQKVCASALDELPALLRERLGNVPVIASDYPSEQMILDGSDPRMLGLFAGVPYGDKSTVGGAPHLDAIFLFQRNIERMAYSSDDVEHEIQVTLVHEAGHFFGLSDAQLEAMGLG